MGVALARAASVEQARSTAVAAAAKIVIHYQRSAEHGE
jgi:formate-dependent phosphoribosylglycinamide formyltransferase (GAR transformylase)